MTDTGATVSVNSSSSVDSVFLNSYSSQPRIPRPTSVRPKVLRKKPWAIQHTEVEGVSKKHGEKTSDVWS